MKVRKILFFLLAAVFPMFISSCSRPLESVASSETHSEANTATQSETNIGPFVVKSGVLVKYNGSEAYVIIPGDLGIKSIGQGAFQYCDSLIAVTIPGSIGLIGEYAFQSCDQLKVVTIEYGVTAIAQQAFVQCSNLRDVILPNSVKTIDRSAFGACTDLQSIYIPESVTKLSNEAFSQDFQLTIYGKAGSTLEQYAKSVGLKFQTAPKDVSNLKISANGIDCENSFAVSRDFDGDGKQETLTLEISHDFPDSNDYNRPIRIKMTIGGYQKTFEDTFNDGVSLYLVDFQTGDPYLDICFLHHNTDVSSRVTIFRYDGRGIVQYGGFRMENTGFAYDGQGKIYYQKDHYNMNQTLADTVFDYDSREIAPVSE